MNQSVWMCAILWAVAFTADAVETATAPAGKVGYMSGTLVAQRADGTLKVMGPKSEVLAGDMLITAKDSYAQVQMNDGAKMTLRPQSNLKIEAFKFNKEEPSADNAVIRLLKGGFRTVTGLIGKRGNPDAYKLRAAAATIGIRGTDFSTRLCATKGCADDDAAGANKVPVNTQVAQPEVVGRMMLVQGDASAKDAAGKTRRLTLGSPVYEGDLLNTGAKSNAVAAFRDGGRVSLQPNTAFHVEKFKYKQADNQENAVLRLLKGGVRVVTGLIGRVNHDNYTFKVATATIGIRGTGFDAWVDGVCADEEKKHGCAGVYVWSGEVVLVADDGVSLPVAVSQAASLSKESGKPVRIITVPASILNNDTPRPDGINVDMLKEFGAEANGNEPGLYVTVHDGQVILAQGDNKLDLGRGETGFTNSVILSRVATTPAFMSGAETEINSGGGASGSNPAMTPKGCLVQ